MTPPKLIVQIAVAGIGYVGLSNAVLLAQHHELVALDIAPTKVDILNDRISPVEDADIFPYLKNRELNLRTTLDTSKGFGCRDLSGHRGRPMKSAIDSAVQV